MVVVLALDEEIAGEVLVVVSSSPSFSTSSKGGARSSVRAMMLSRVSGDAF